MPSRHDPRDGVRLAVLGPTASGKSVLALALARRHPDIELVSVDSMQVYRGMDIGTAKPSAAERREVRHHLLDLVHPSERFTVAQYGAAFDEAVAGIAARGGRAVLVGGTGLYLRAVVDRLEIPGEYPVVRGSLEAEPDTVALHDRLRRLDPVAARRMEPTNRRRVVRALEVTLGSGRPFSSFGPGLTSYPPTSVRLIGLRVPRDELDERIERRFHALMEGGLLDEVRRLAADPAGLSPTARQALGYRELLAHLEGRVTLQAAVDAAVARTRQFARRQERWFRRDPRIEWLDASVAGEELLGTLEDVLGDSLPCS